MRGFPAPDPYLLAFFTYRELFFVELVSLLALVRLIVARGPSRRLAGLAFGFGLLAVAVKYGPVVFGLYEGVLTHAASFWRYAAGGYLMVLLPSGVFLASAATRGHRWWGLDALHGLLIAAFLGLWGYAIWG